MELSPMRIYRLSSSGRRQLSPQEILGRCTHAFAYVESDVHDTAPLGVGVLDSYRDTLNNYDKLKQQFDFLPENPPSIEEVERIWHNAIHMHVWLDRADDRRFSAIVNNDYRFELVFSDTVSTKQRRDTIDRVAALLEYDATIVDEPDCVDPLVDDSDAQSTNWW